MNKILTFQDLQVWQKSHQLVLSVYQSTGASFPRDEQYGLVSQLRRAAASIPTNIAEGYKRCGAKDYARFVNVANASLEELKYHLILSKDLGFIDASRYLSLFDSCNEVGRMLNGLYSSLIRKAGK
jgi:four helix bundle protein